MEPAHPHMNGDLGSHRDTHGGGSGGGDSHSGQDAHMPTGMHAPGPSLSSSNGMGVSARQAWLDSTDGDDGGAPEFEPVDPYSVGVTDGDDDGELDFEPVDLHSVGVEANGRPSDEHHERMSSRISHVADAAAIADVIADEMAEIAEIAEEIAELSPVTKLVESEPFQYVILLVSVVFVTTSRSTTVNFQIMIYDCFCPYDDHCLHCICCSISLLR